MKMVTHISINRAQRRSTTLTKIIELRCKSKADATVGYYAVKLSFGYKVCLLLIHSTFLELPVVPKYAVTRLLGGLA